MSKYKLVTLDPIDTDTGNLFMIYRDWDSFHENYVPKMVYATTLFSKTSKGPILHKERAYYLTALSGEVQVEMFLDGKIETVWLKQKGQASSQILILEPNVPVRIINESEDQVAVLINCASKAWHPDNTDTIKWNNWEEFNEKQT